MCGEVWENVTKNLAQKIASISRGDSLKRTHWVQFARECGLNPRQVIGRADALAKSAIAEAELAASEVAAMPAGDHAILGLTRQAVERRAHQLLTRLRESDDEQPAIKGIDEQAGHTEEAAEAVVARTQ
jgi:serine/threonine-protein kinase HipA